MRSVYLVTRREKARICHPGIPASAGGCLPGLRHPVRHAGVTRSVPNQASAGTTGPLRLRQGGRFYSFSQTCCTECNMFVKKIKSVPCCRRRSGLQVWHQAETSATA